MVLYTCFSKLDGMKLFDNVVSLLHVSNEVNGSWQGLFDPETSHM
jgi:hypothetical protein